MNLAPATFYNSPIILRKRNDRYNDCFSEICSRVSQLEASDGRRSRHLFVKNALKWNLDQHLSEKKKKKIDRALILFNWLILFVLFSSHYSFNVSVAGNIWFSIARKGNWTREAIIINKRYLPVWNKYLMCTSCGLPRRHIFNSLGFHTLNVLLIFFQT